MIQPQDWSVYNPADLQESTRDFANDALELAEHRQLGLKLSLAATARDSDTSDMHGRKLAIAQLNPRAAYELVDMITGKFLGTAKLGEATKKAEREIGCEPDEATTGGPRSKMAKVAAGAESAE